MRGCKAEMKLSEREEIHLYNLSLIPAGLVLIAFLVSFVYLMQSGSLRTISDFLEFAIPFWLLIIETIFFSYEVLYGKKLSKSFNRKRFIGRTIITVSAFGLFGLLIILLNLLIFQFPWINEPIMLFLTGVIWFVAWIVLLTRLKGIFNKLSKGEW